MKKSVSCAFYGYRVRGAKVLRREHVLQRLHCGGELGGPEYVRMC